MLSNHIDKCQLKWRVVQLFMTWRRAITNSFHYFKLYSIYIKIIIKHLFQYFMETKKEISLEDFMSNSWSRLKQLIFAQSINNKVTEHPADDESDRQVEEGEGEDQDENEDESDSVDEEVKYTEPEELDESQYDEETKLIVEGIFGLSFKKKIFWSILDKFYDLYS